MSLDMLPKDPLPLALIGAAVLCFSAYWARWSGRNTVSLKGAWVKAGATGLVAVALLRDAALIHTGRSAQSQIWPMALGLLFGAVGDFALARRSDRAFLTGMAGFAIGHLIYAAALWSRTVEINALLMPRNVVPAAGGISRGQWIALCCLLALLASTEIWLAPKTGKLRWPVRGYVGVIGLMAAIAILLADHPFAQVLQLGAALFVLSDLLLALRLFVVRGARAQHALSLALWPAYWLGQMLLMAGALGYWTAPKG